jgi:phytoene dehydrogenase-like protein
MMSMRVHPRVPLELELQRHGFRQIELSPGYVYLHPDGTSLVFWRDPEKTAAEIRRYSERDAEAFLAFMKVVNAFIDMAVPMMRVDPTEFNLGAKFTAFRAALRNRRLKPELMALLTGSAYQAAIERFEHPITISAMCCLTGLAGSITSDGSGIYYALLGFLHRFGGPRGWWHAEPFQRHGIPPERTRRRRRDLGQSQRDPCQPRPRAGRAARRWPGVRRAQ